MSKHWSPTKGQLVDDFSDMPAFVRRAPQPRGNGGKLRGRNGIEEIAQLVGSKRFRDIKRSGNFMPGQFQLWNAKENGGNGKYWGGYQDVDGDGLEHEFVVRRGGDGGPLIAVNGYTTKQSDWGARKEFYEIYPSRDKRSGKTVKSFMRDEYYVPNYDGGMDVKSWVIKPGSEDDYLKEWNMYNNYTPKSMSPYQAVNKYIVKPALEIYLANRGIDKTTYLKDQDTGKNDVGKLSRLASAIYDYLVRNQVIDFLRANGRFAQYEANYQFNHPNWEADPDYEVKLEKYVLNRKEVKDYIKDYVSKIIINKGTRRETIAQIATMIQGDELASPPRPTPVRQRRPMVMTPVSPPPHGMSVSDDDDE